MHSLSLSLSLSTPRNTQNISISPLHKILRGAEERFRTVIPFHASRELLALGQRHLRDILSSSSITRAQIHSGAAMPFHERVSVHASRSQRSRGGEITTVLSEYPPSLSPISRSLALPPRIRSKYFIPNDAKTVAIYV